MAQKPANSRKSASGSGKSKTKSTSARKTSGKKTSRTKSRSKKNTIPAYKLIVYCALAISACVLIYLVADIASKSPEVKTETVSITDRYEEPAKKEEVQKQTSPAKVKPATNKTETKKAETKKVEPKKTEPKKIETPQVKKENAKKTETPVKKDSSVKKETPAKTENKKTPAVEEKSKSFNFPAAQNNATLVFVFDDGGQNMAHLEKFVTLPFPITVAVLPQIKCSVQAAERVRSSGNELMLHQPMQSVNKNVNPGPGAITPDMTEEQIISTLFTNVSQIGPIAGFNNHEGSGITADAEKMAVVMKFASQEGIYFLDSRTNVETKVPYVAEQLGYSYYERNIFLDNEKTKDNAIKELNKGLIIANKTGQAVMIGHIWSADFLPQLLREAYPELVSKGYKFALVSHSKKVR